MTLTILLIAATACAVFVGRSLESVIEIEGGSL